MVVDSMCVGDWKICFDQCWQFLCYIVVYVVVFCLWCMGGVEVEFCVFVEVVVFGIGYIIVVWVGIWCDDDYVVFGCIVLCIGFGDEILFGVGQVVQLVQYWQWLYFCLWWQVYGELYVVVQCG